MLAESTATSSRAAASHEGATLTQPFLPVLEVFGDPEVARILSERSLTESWLEVERALAAVQAELGQIPQQAAAAIMDEVSIDKVDLEALRTGIRTVGYPILPLIEQVSAECSALVGDYIHWGATTQDIMDTALALQSGRALCRIQHLATSLAAVLAQLAETHRFLVMAGRTHAQQAVPTTLGAKVAVWLDEFCRHLERLDAVRSAIGVVQLFGGAGTAAALGPNSRETRRMLAERLDLSMTDVPWHTARDRIAELGFVLAATAATAGKIASEIIDLSRTEIGELREGGVDDHGASSTMPQKINPILSETVVAMSTQASSQCLSLLAAMKPGHERSAGEWQIEWESVPMLFCLTAGCLLNLRRALSTIEVRHDRIEANLHHPDGLVMAEAAMIELAPTVGRLRAHHLVTRACQFTRERDVPLRDALRSLLAAEAIPASFDDALTPSGYVGEAPAIVAAALDRWHQLGAARAATSAGDGDRRVAPREAMSRVQGKARRSH